MRKKSDTVERFMAKVQEDPTTSCWNWTSGKRGGDYGCFKLLGKSWLAHRAAYTLFIGEIPPGDGWHGTCVMHSCDNPRCVNPGHLSVGTHSQNMADCKSKNRHRPPGARRGSDHSLARLTDEKVVSIRAECEHGATQRSVARKYGISFPHVSEIVHRKAWKHIL